jgi:NTE family protein
VSSDGLTRLIKANLPQGDIKHAKLPLHIVATDFLSGTPVVFSSGDAARAIVASCAIPAAFAPVQIDGRYLADGGLANNTPVRIAVDLGAKRLIVLPTGFACALESPPRGAIANALHALTLLIASQLVADLKALPSGVEYRVVPSLCPSATSPFDFTRAAELIERAEQQTISWIRADGLNDRTIPMSLAPHTHART